MKKTKNTRVWAGPARGLLWLLMTAVAVSACGSKQTPLAELTPEDLWVRGVEAYNAEEWADAIRYFDRFTLVGGADPRVYQSRMYVAQAHFNREEFVTAATEFSRLAGDLGRAETAAEARFMTCRSYEELSPRTQLDQEYTRAAIDHCQALIQLFPTSPFRERAEPIVDRLRGKLAKKVYETGDWYMGRRAYDSAIIYFEDVAEQYPLTEWAPKALARMVEIYGILEWADEESETRDRLLRDYPESPEARALAAG